MKLPEHVTLSYLLAQFAVQPEYGIGGTALMIAAGCLPDLDGLTIFFGWRSYRKYHRIVGHGLPITLLGPLGLALLGGAFGLAPWLPLWGWLQLSLLGHLVTDICFYNWPVQLGWPVTSRGVGIGLLRWNDLVPTLLLYSATAVAVWSPVLAVPAAVVGIGGLALYLLWRARRPNLDAAWLTWLTGGWAARSLPLWRWLTGDFIS
jgi:LexA-binding, inner membrane-associated putative hydrolase